MSCCQRLLLTFAIFFLSFVYVQGARWRSMVLTDHNGKDYVVNMSDRVFIAFDSGNIVISDNVSRTDIPLESVARWEMSETLYPDDLISAVDVPGNDKSGIINYDEGVIRFSASSGSGTHNVYDMDGRIVGEFGADGAGVVDMSGFGKGVYIVRLGKLTLKVLVR